MYKFRKRIATLLLTATVAVSTAMNAFAIWSPVRGNGDSNTTVSGFTSGTDTAMVTDVQSTTKTALINNTVTNTLTKKNKTYTVNVIASGTIKTKYKTVHMVLNSGTQVKAKIFKNKKAKKTNKIVIRAASGQKLTASQFNKKAFKGYKGKIYVRKSAMTKKQYKKLVKKLRKGGFKGKIIYKK